MSIVGGVWPHSLDLTPNLVFSSPPLGSAPGS